MYLLAIKAAAAVTLIAILSTDTMGGLAVDILDAVTTPAEASVAAMEMPETRIRVGEVLYSAEGDRIGAIRAVRHKDGDYTVLYTAKAMFLADDIEVAEGRLQLRAVDMNLAELADPADEGTTRSAALSALPR